MKDSGEHGNEHWIPVKVEKFFNSCRTSDISRRAWLCVGTHIIFKTQKVIVEQIC